MYFSLEKKSVSYLKCLTPLRPLLCCGKSHFFLIEPDFIDTKINVLFNTKCLLCENFHTNQSSRFINRKLHVFTEVSINISIKLLFSYQPCTFFRATVMAVYIYIYLNCSGIERKSEPYYWTWLKLKSRFLTVFYVELLTQIRVTLYNMNISY